LEIIDNLLNKQAAYSRVLEDTLKHFESCGKGLFVAEIKQQLCRRIPIEHLPECVKVRRHSTGSVCQGAS